MPDTAAAPDASTPDAALRAVPRDLAVGMFRRMTLIREFDTVVPRLVQMGGIRGTAHSAVGQEAVAVGACSALDTTDFISSTHRGHGHAIAKGVDVAGMMAELFGRATGICGGKGGSMHIADFSVGMLGANGVVGGGFGIATGAALALRMRGSDRVVVCFVGDSALNQGAFLENANYAALHALPVIYVCENNQFAMSMRAARATNLAHLADRAAAFGFPGVTTDGMDAVATQATVAAAVARARAGDGPTLVVADCYRFDGHHVGDTEVYRTSDEAAAWRDRDPILQLRRRLIAAGWLSEPDAAAIETAEAQRVADAVEAAERAPLLTADDAQQHIYA